MEESRYEYLKKKLREFHASLKVESQQKNLNSFISDLQNFFKVKITKTSFPFSEIESPTRLNIPGEPKHTKFVIDSGESEIISVIKDWLIEQESETFLISNYRLINQDDWLEIDLKILLENFNEAFIKLDLLHNLIFSPTSKNLLISLSLRMRS